MEAQKEYKVGSLVRQKKVMKRGIVGVLVEVEDHPYPWHGKIYRVCWKDGTASRYSALAFEYEVEVLV